MMLRRHVAAASIFAASLFLTGRADAQSQGFSADRFDPAERGSDWFTQESLDLRSGPRPSDGRGGPRPAAGIIVDYAHNPLVIYNSDGSVRSAIVSDQLILHAGGALVIGDRLRIGVNLPIALVSTGQNGTSQGVTFTAPSSAALGDLRLGADVRMFGRYGDPFTLAAGLQIFAPTGDQSQFAGDGSFRVQPRLLVAGQVGAFVYSGKLGFEYRENQAFAGDSLGSQVILGAAAGAQFLDGKLVIGPELWGSTVVTTSQGAFTTGNTPLEALLGAHSQVGDFRVGAGVGHGLTKGFGEPDVRLLATIEWAPPYQEPPPPVIPPPPPPPPPAPPPPPSDMDNDGIPDSEDACPAVPGVRTDDPKTNGCPPDRDKDGVPDAEDACPDVPGVHTNDPKTNGCPADRDGDGIPDNEDACPDVPGPRNADPKKNGCPIAYVQENQIKITEQVKFRFNSAQLDPAGDPVLQAVLKILQDNPKITKLEIQGHTDNVGAKAYNQTLSTNRATSVMKWLTKHGIDPKRLTAKGYGMSTPIADNATDEGRQENRRVEFHIEGGSAEPTGTQPPAPGAAPAPADQRKQ